MKRKPKIPKSKDAIYIDRDIRVAAVALGIAIGIVTVVLVAIIVRLI